MTKLVLKYGDIEIEYDGPEDFLKQELPKFIENVVRLGAGGSEPATGLKKTQRAAAPGNSQATAASTASVSTIAQKLGVDSGRELIMAAAYSYSNSGSVTFTKKQLRDKIREAKTFFKSSYTNNFDNYVARLVKAGRLNHTSGENYA